MHNTKPHTLGPIYAVLLSSIHHPSMLTLLQHLNLHPWSRHNAGWPTQNIRVWPLLWVTTTIDLASPNLSEVSRCPHLYFQQSQWCANSRISVFILHCHRSCGSEPFQGQSLLSGLFPTKLTLYQPQDICPHCLQCLNLYLWSCCYAGRPTTSWQVHQ